MKQIHELNERSTALGLGDFLPVDNGNDTEKIDYTKLAKAIIEQYNLSSLGGSNRTLKATLDALQDSVDDDLVPKSDIINNVTTSAAGKVLDASQGKVLQDQITALNSNLKLTMRNIRFDNISFSAGTPGTRGAQAVDKSTIPSNEYIVAIFIAYTSNSSAVIPFAFCSGATGNYQNIYFNVYRATSNAVDNFAAVVRVVTVNVVAN